jgi:diguanylate cyclase (GGDEF)-like protein
MRQPTASDLRSDDATWLCPTALDRARLLENSRRVSRARSITSAAIGLCLIYAAPTYGWWMIGVFVLSALNTQTLEARIRRSRRPEYHVAFSIVFSQALLATVAALTGGPRSVILPLISILCVFAATRFRTLVAIAASVSALLMVVIATLGAHFAETINHPGGLLVSAALVIGISAAAQALNSAELQYRSSAVLDPLTGLLNRQGLERRFNELAEQAALTGAPVSLLICDLDHFKAINDSYGHATGDAVLRDVAYRLRKQLRSFELIYRFGGEEFLVLLPGATLADARDLAERLCEATREYRPGGVAITLSVGIGTLWGDEVTFGRLFGIADRALYRAKSGGRDRVGAPDEPEAPPQIARQSA